MRRDIRSVFEVTEFEPGRLIQIESIESTFPIEVRRWVVPTGPSTCQVTANIGGGPGAAMTLLQPLLTRMAQRSVNAAYDRLKELLETRD